MNLLVEGINEFTFNYLELLSKSNDNECFSPLTISNAITVIWLGSSNSARKQIGHIFGFRKNLKIPEKLIEELTKLIKSLDHDSFKFRNQVIIPENVQNDPKALIKSEFMRYFKGCFNEIFLKENSTNILRNTTQWLSVDTRCMADFILLEKENSTFLVYYNLFGFKGEWKHPFCSNLTHQIKSNFNSKTPFIDAMKSYEAYDYTEFRVGNFSCQMVRMEYVGKTSMYIILPRYCGNISEILYHLNPRELKKKMQKMKKTDLNFDFPKFTIKTCYKIHDQLKHFGVTKGFNSQKSDLTGITKMKGVHITNYYHKAAIFVNEEGTNTGGVFEREDGKFRKCADKSVTVCVNQPFLFFIYDDDIHAILFAGKVENI